MRSDGAGSPARVIEDIEVTGTVQGVGFRPFVHRLATGLGLDGHVANELDRVRIRVAGPPAAVDDLAGRLVAEAPPLARIDRIERVTRADGAVGRRPTAGFVIAESGSEGPDRTSLPPDAVMCADCRRELLDPGDRRYRHPFITCTNCGPRFTVIRDLPYDRPTTTMADFTMCSTCRSEYEDPGDRRHHAQTIACHDCGPVLALHARQDRRPDAVGPGALAAAREGLGAGRIVAVKGLGGYHLACDATDDATVARLRGRKHRPDKPFAVMVGSLDEAAALARIDGVERSLLSSTAGPIVLLPARAGSPLSELVAPGNPLVGVMLAPTPLHHLLVDGHRGPLVMTSGNRSGEPITFRDDEVASRLGGLCDVVLTHDRPIEVPCDDSVVRVVDGAVLPVRRARGYAPLPIGLPRAGRAVLATGGELKNTFTLAAGNRAWVSQHTGDMENLATLDAFEASVERFTRMYRVEPDVVAVDAHPGYRTTTWGQRAAAPTVTVQHHHAHVAAVMAEHGLDPRVPVLGFAFDGTGYGDDGTIWGGELLVADAGGYERVGHLAEVPLPGGDAAVHHPCRVALAHLHAARVPWTADLPPVGALTEDERQVLAHQLERGLACVPTSSMGRLFDAVASLLGLRHDISYEAQAAIELEIAAGRSGAHRGYRFADTGRAFAAAPVVRSIVADRAAGASVEDCARRFHLAVADVVLSRACRTRDEGGPTTVALSGGVFQNALLTRLCRQRLHASGFDVRSHRLVPANDGGLSLGQAFVAAHRDA